MVGFPKFVTEVVGRMEASETLNVGYIFIKQPNAKVRDITKFLCCLQLTKRIFSFIHWTWYYRVGWATVDTYNDEGMTSQNLFHKITSVQIKTREQHLFNVECPTGDWKLGLLHTIITKSDIRTRVPWLQSRHTQTLRSVIFYGSFRMCNALMMITGVIETSAKCRSYRFHWRLFSL